MNRARRGLFAAALALAFAAGTIACSAGDGDDCVKAEDHLTECMATSASSSSTGAPAAIVCTGTNLCQAQCVNQFSCASISNGDQSYLGCLATCQGM